MYTEIRQQEVRSMIHRLLKSSKSEGYAIVEMKSVFLELTLNIVMRMIAGKRHSGDDDEQDKEEPTEFQEKVMETFQANKSPINRAHFVPLVRWFGGQKKLENQLKKLQLKRDKFMQDLLEECRKMRGRAPDGENQIKNKTVIDVLLSLQETELEYYIDELIKSIIQVMLTGGTDTSSSTMEWTLSALLNNQACLKTAQKEIDTITGFERMINDSDLGHLPYLQGVINETLRMYPVAPLLVPRESSEDCIVGGYRVPKGSMLVVNI